MKKVLLGLFILIGSVQFVLAGDDVAKVSSWAKKSFEKQFPGAQYPRWYEIEESEIYAVSFGYNEQSLMAYVDRSGIVLATLRNVDMNYLPFPVKESIQSKYAGYNIVKIEELTMNSDLSYLVQLENSKRKIGIRMFPGGNHYEIKSEKIK